MGIKLGGRLTGRTKQAARWLFKPSYRLRRGRISGWATILAIPAALAVLLLLGFGLWQWRAAAEVDRQLQTLREAGIPVDDDSMHRRFLQSTDSRLSGRWMEVVSVVSTLPYQPKVPLFNQKYSLPVNLEPSESWPLSERVADFLSRMRPVIDRIPSDRIERPVYQPLLFDGYSTLLMPLQDALQLVHLLQLDAEYALHELDRPRGLKDLQLLQTVADAHAWDFAAVAQVLNMNMHQVRWDVIQRSLYAVPWEPAELTALQACIGSAVDIESVWRSLIDGERAMLLATLQDQNSKVFEQSPIVERLASLPSQRLKIFSYFATLRELAAEGLSRLPGRVVALEQKRWPDLAEPLIARSFASFLPVAHAFVDHENQRRLTRAAVAVKQFQLEHGRWPEALSELGAQGPAVRDLATVEGGMFSYGVQGDTAYVSYIRDSRANTNGLISAPASVAPGTATWHHAASSRVAIK